MALTDTTSIILNEPHSEGLPVEMVLLTPGRKNSVLAAQVASNMGLTMPHRALAVSDFSDAVAGYLEQLPVTFLLKSGQIKMVYAGDISKAFILAHSIIPTQERKDK